MRKKTGHQPTFMPTPEQIAAEAAKIREEWYREGRSRACRDKKVYKVPRYRGRGGRDDT